MNGISRYIFRQLATGTILVTLGLTTIIWLTQSLRFIEMIVNRGLDIGGFLRLTMLLMPDILTIILPLALFAAVVFVYSKMVGDRELVVMRATGLSQGMLAYPAILLALIAMGISYTLNLYFLPKSYQMFRDFQWQVRYSYSHVVLQEGTFNSLTPEVTVYVRERTADGQLKGILAHMTKDPEKPTTIMAERGALVITETGPRVIMFNGNRQEVDKKKHKMSILFFDRYALDIAGTKADATDRYREPRERMLHELLGANEETVPDARDRGRFIVEGHKRLASPLWILGFVMVGVSALISGSITRRSQTRRIVMAVCLVVLLQAGFLGVENLAAKRLELIPLIYVAALLPILVGLSAIHFNPRAGRRAPAAVGS
ncbi:LPS export ABC transporter permease LptF [Magnetospira sp. QH-2]|uniref:LPS export ABC transporter permease LptF n=1 Tax=Magnetospira sp. (strain QH-2) TaxID=1288970 RepID=UPI0003E81C05|nr:LPS export ABC transporter permease LptF [Magnetospira sp. QH-2]CCQ74410.1 putative permease lptF [Magnetospira sp. QH-2]